MKVVVVMVVTSVVMIVVVMAMLTHSLAYALTHPPLPPVSG